MLGNCGVTNQVAVARSADMMCWAEGFGCVDARARDENVKKQWRKLVVTHLNVVGDGNIEAIYH